MKLITKEDHKAFKIKFKYLQSILALQSYEYIVNSNFNELIKAINIFEEDDSMSLMNISKRNILDSYLLDILRLLHNYLSSTHSFREHTFSICKKFVRLQSTELEKAKNIFTDPIVQLVKDIRHYVQHVGLKSIGTSVKVFKIENGIAKDEIFYIGIDIPELLTFSGLTSSSKSFLNNYEYQDTLNLKPLLKEYQEIIKKYYIWFYGYYRRIFREEILICENVIEKK